MKRLSWDETWMSVADTVAMRSKCDGRQIGALIVDASNRPISTGYNGPPRGYEDWGETCGSGWCPRQVARGRDSEGLRTSYGLSCPSIHAEANALMFADRRDYAGGTIYVSAACCADCGKLIANSGLMRVVMRLDERDMHRDPNATVSFVQSCGIQVDVW